MDYLLEIADLVLQALSEPQPEASINARRLVRIQSDFDAARKSVSQERATSFRSRADFLDAEQVLAREVMADLLARQPTRIPALLSAVKRADFCPSFVADVVSGAVGHFDPPKTKLPFMRKVGDSLSRLLAPEYAELVQVRPDRVAAVLVSSAAWRRARRSVSTESRRHRNWLNRREQRKPSRIAAVREFLESDADKRRFVGDLRRELLTKPRLLQRLAEAAGVAVPFSLAFALELDEVAASRAKRGATHPDDCTDRIRSQPLESYLPAPSHKAQACRFPSRLAEERRLLGLAFSGGGIRSATFNLGVIQGLARTGLLKEVDYLSSVSGGGYISGWLAAWIKRVGGVSVVERELEMEPLPRPSTDAARPVQFLREYSNYLAPKTGVFNADFWSMVATWWRNTLLNQLVLIPFVAAAMVVPWLIWLSLGNLDAPDAHNTATSLRHIAPKSLVAVWVLAMSAAFGAGWQLRSFRITKEDPVNQKGMLGQVGVLWLIVLPVLVVSFMVAGMLLASSKAFERWDFKVGAFWDLFWLFTACHASMMIFGRCWRGFVHNRVSSLPTPHWRIRASVVITVAIVVSCALGALGLVVTASTVFSLTAAFDTTRVSWHWTVMGLPIVLTITSFVNFLQIGILGRSFPDSQREWWSRLGAWLNLGGLTWLAIVGLAIYSPYVVERTVAWSVHAAAGKIAVAGGTVAWILTTSTGVLFGSSERAASLIELIEQPLWRRGLVRIAPYVFIGGLFVLLSTSMYWLLSGAHPPSAVTLATFGSSPWGELGDWLVMIPLALLIASIAVSARVDVNEFSMHHFYKNRLVRCFLGASREGSAAPLRRSPDPFTGFDPEDDLWLADLQVNPGRFDADLCEQKPTEVLAGYHGPFLIMNTALNLVKGDNLAWQERKAQSFVFTPLFSGYDGRANAAGASNSRLTCFAMRPTTLFGYPPYGISLGTAMAISGAAANPNSGYHSSPAIGFLMTLFNARLGWWLGNPRDELNWLRSTPRLGLLYLFKELFGLTNDQTQFVNLSDGGHFENLGIYELVRRRCRFIIACDAEQDEHLTFNGLAASIRNCRADFGAEISIRATRIHPSKDTRLSKLHCVIGDISYSDGARGTLVYMKASITGDEPADVSEYSAREPSFPHHSTLGDQFFDESQFESYRKLGYHISTTTLRTFGGNHSLADRFAQLVDFWYPASSAIEEHLANHLEQFDDLLERVRVGPGLEFADAAFFGNDVDATSRNQLYVGLHMLDLMQRVFIDLNIENDPDHPHIRGWRMIFEKWAQQRAVQDAWRATSGSFSSRFQNFVSELIPTQPIQQSRSDDHSNSLNLRDGPHDEPSRANGEDSAGVTITASAGATGRSRRDS